MTPVIIRIYVYSLYDLYINNRVIFILCRSFVARRQRAGRPADESCKQHEQFESDNSSEPAGEPAISPAISPAIDAFVNDYASIRSNGHLHRRGEIRRRGCPPKSGTDQPRERGRGGRFRAQEKTAPLQNDLYQLPAGGAREGLLQDALPGRVYEVSRFIIKLQQIYTLSRLK